MKTKGHKTEKPVKVSDQELLSLVAEKLKGRVLFPESHARAKAFLRNMTIAIK
ncbi:hypothetical protein [Chitinophaga alhagiae]|uniref:hypothetical protein n=1 Tax=Chitinophaga alhagiae TaxID=2203219 RepID=UPI0013001A8A|nr:hypothetical protein [Chitinophaga alhagiae]